MRSIFFILLSLLFSLSARAQTSKTEVKKISGRWLYLSGSGGFTGKGPGWVVGSNIQFEYKKNGRFSKIENEKKTEKDKFKIMAKVGQASLLIYKNLPVQRYEIKSDTLFLSDTMADGFQYIFVRKK